jgi:hypothetical protein
MVCDSNSEFHGYSLPTSVIYAFFGLPKSNCREQAMRSSRPAKGQIAGSGRVVANPDFTRYGVSRMAK